VVIATHVVALRHRQRGELELFGPYSSAAADREAGHLARRLADDGLLHDRREGGQMGPYDVVVAPIERGPIRRTRFRR
jgi:hypothetical protein